MPSSVVQNQHDLAQLAARLRGTPIVCLDTEFASESRYFAALGTIQIAARDEVVLVDAVAVRDISPLAELLTDANTVKVFHAGEQDLQIFYRLIGQPVAPVFDTQVAAAFLGHGEQISLRGLLRILVGVQLEKESTFTDWLARPLSKTQIEYALDDVRYLERAYQALVEKLRAGGRLQWVAEELRALEDAQRFLPGDEQQAYLSIKGAERLSPSALGMLQELAAWRELTARRLNVPAGRVAIDPVLLELARRPRQSVKQLTEVRGMHPRQAEKYGAEILEALRRGAGKTAPSIARGEQFPETLEPTVDFLLLCMRAVAVEQSISPGILANRSDLRKLAKSGAKADIRLLRGWRHSVAGKPLLEALRGNVGATIVPQTGQVHLEWRKPASGPTGE